MNAKARIISNIKRLTKIKEGVPYVLHPEYEAFLEKANAIAEKVSQNFIGMKMNAQIRAQIRASLYDKITKLNERYGLPMPGVNVEACTTDPNIIHIFIVPHDHMGITACSCGCRFAIVMGQSNNETYYGR